MDAIREHKELMALLDWISDQLTGLDMPEAAQDARMIKGQLLDRAKEIATQEATEKLERAYR